MVVKKIPKMCGQKVNKCCRQRVRWSKIKKIFCRRLICPLGHKNIPFFYPTAIFFAKRNSGGRGLQTAFVCGGGGGKIISLGNMEKIHNFYTSCDGNSAF